MARLTSIATQLSTILAGLTTANGYSFDFGSINEADPALQSFPSAIITYTDEVNAFGRGEGLSYYSYADAEFQIKVRCELSVTEGAPLHAIDAEYDTVVSAMKQAFAAILGVLPLDFEAVVSYRGFRKENDIGGDAFSPGSIITTWGVRYQNH
jgi:hypothetical protein